MPRKHYGALALVCRRFYMCMAHPSLWSNIQLSEQALSARSLLSAVSCRPRMLRLQFCDVTGPLALPMRWLEMPLHRIQALSFSYSSISDDVLAFLLERTPSLMYLDLAGTSAGDHVLFTLARHCPLLTHLSLRMATNISDAGMCAVVEACSKLEVLNVSWTPVTQRAVACITTQLPALTEVDLSGCNVTDQNVTDLVRTAPQLAVAELSDCYELTDVAVHQLAVGCSRLFAISFSRCHHVTVGALLELVEKPTLQHVNIYGSVPEMMAEVERVRTDIQFNKCHISFVEVPFAIRATLPFSRS